MSNPMGNMMGNIDKIEVFTNTDVYLHQNLICPKGFDIKLANFDTMLYLAQTNNCNIIVRTNDKWFLKSGLYLPSINFIKFNQKKKLYPNMSVYLLKYKDNSLFQ
jgi:hypothetical protein